MRTACHFLSQNINRLAHFRITTSILFLSFKLRKFSTSTHAMYRLAQLLTHKVCVYERLCSMGTTVDLGNVIGPRGPQGVQGIQGPKGETGPQGPKGETGPAGTTNWNNITNRPFNQVGSAPLSIDSSGDLVCYIDIIRPLECSQEPQAYDLSLAIGEGATSASKQDIAIGTSAHTTGHNQHNASGDNIAIGTNAACTNTAQSAIAIGCDADCSSSHSVALGERSISTGTYEVSVGNQNEQRRICFVDNPSNDYDAVNLTYFTNRVPVTVMLCSNVSTSTAVLNTNMTFATFSNIKLPSSAYDLMYTYIKLKNFTPDCIIFQVQGQTQTPTKQQVFTVSQSQNVYISNVLNLNILADCFVNYGMITNASSTMLNLARVELSMSSKTEILMNVSSASAMNIDKNSTYAMYLQLRPASYSV